MKSRAIATLIALICLGATSAQGSSISVYFTSDGSDCDANVAANTPVTWYILALLYGDAANNGITGAEFRQSGTPPGWFVNWTASPTANIDIRGPGDLGMGANIAFPICQTGFAGGVVLLYTANGFATTQVGRTCLSIEAHTTPSNPNFNCPLVTLCDTAFTRICVVGGRGVINGDCYGTCSLGVEPSAWTKVKSLYQ